MPTRGINEIESLRILVLGNPGVGKSSLTHLIAYNQPLRHTHSSRSKYNVEVCLHQYRKSRRTKSLFFIELYDVSGHPRQFFSRRCICKRIHGIILVHDLQNGTTHTDIYDWLLNQNRVRNGFGNIPVLVIGTKLDLAQKRRLSYSNGVASLCDAEEIYLNCLDNASLGHDSRNKAKLNRFFNTVIARKRRKFRK